MTGRARGYNSTRRQWWLVIVLLIVSTLAAIDRQVIALLVDPIRASLHITDTGISLILGAAFGLANTLFTLPAGYLADRIDRRGLILTGALAWSLMTIACGAAGSFMQLFLARAGVGCGESVITPAATSLLSSGVSPERRARGFSVFSMSFTGGSSVALIAGGLLIGAITVSGPHSLPLLGPVLPWQLTLILIGLAGLPVSLLVLSLREPPKPAQPYAPGRSMMSETRPVREGGYLDAWSTIRGRWRLYTPLLLFQVAMLMLSLSYAAWLPAMVGRLWGLSYAQIGLTVGLMMLCLPPVGLWIAGHLMDSAAARQGVRGPVAVGCCATILVAIAASATPLAPTLPAFWVAFGALMLVSGTVFPLVATVTASVTPQRSMGKITAVQFFLAGLVAPVLGPTVVASVSDVFFSGPWALARSMSVVCAVYSVISLLALVAVLRALKAEHVHPPQVSQPRRPLPG
jgi:MFS transporter, Spinster family, sphingosine-1-phosphate transporter